MIYSQMFVFFSSNICDSGAEEAAQAGLVSRLVPEDMVDAEVGIRIIKIVSEVCKKIVPFSRVLTLRPPTPPPDLVE